MNTVALFLWSRRNDTCLVTESHGAQLPMLDVPPASRIPALVQHWCQERALSVSFVSVIGGVGRANGSVHWGAWIRLDRSDDRYASVPLAVIEARANDAPTRRLATALRLTLGCSNTSGWIGHDPHWPEIVQAWIARRRRTDRVGAVTPIRAESCSIVASARVGNRAAFFIARPLPFKDAQICDLLNRQSPGLFAQTLAYDGARGWWLTADIDARDSKTFIEQDDHARRLAHVLSGIANLQHRCVDAIDLETLCFRISLDTIRGGLGRAMDLTYNEACWTASTRRTLIERVGELWETAGADHCRASWIHSDPSPDNVRVDNQGRVVFIDLENPWHGPMPLMGALTLHSMSRRCGWTENTNATRCGRGWRDYVTACNLTNDRHTLESWTRLALLVRLIRGVDKAATRPSLLLYEETPRRSRAIASELQRLLCPS